MSRKTLASALLFIFFLIGCAGMPISTMYKLHAMNPMEIDPAQFKVAIRADERIGIGDDGVRVSLKFDAADGNLHIDDTYFVEVIRNPILTADLYDDTRAGQAVTVLQLSDDNAQKMAHALSLVKPYSEGGGAASFSFGVEIRGACMHDPIPAGSVRVDILMQASNDDGFFVITRGLDLRKVDDGADDMFENLPDCL